MPVLSICYRATLVSLTLFSLRVRLYPEGSLVLHANTFPSWPPPWWTQLLISFLHGTVISPRGELNRRSFKAIDWGWAAGPGWTHRCP